MKLIPKIAYLCLLFGLIAKMEGWAQNKEANPVTLPSGLQYIDLREGTGEMPQKGQKLTVHYAGYLKDGTKFDSSYDRHQHFEYYHEVTYLIPGWTEGVSTLRVGGKRRLIIPPRLAYGSAGAGDKIPPNATLIFEIELLSVE
jgi:FKBP-type peptidyl-prolyl cis-trans isomerase